MLNKNNKKYFIFIVPILIGIVLILINFLVFNKKNKNNYTGDIIYSEDVELKEVPYENKDNQLENKDERAYKVYQDRDYNYQVKYPSHLTVHEGRPDVAFKTDSGYWQINISVVETPYYDIAEWVKYYIEYLERNKDIDKVEIEKEILINGNKAVLFNVRYIDTYESLHNTKDVFFIKNNNLYTISTRGVEYEEIWESFKFLE